MRLPSFREARAFVTWRVRTDADTETADLRAVGIALRLVAREFLERHRVALTNRLGNASRMQFGVPRSSSARPEMMMARTLRFLANACSESSSR